VVLYHRDLEEDDPRARNSQTIGRAFISVIAPECEHACVDAELPSAGPSYPRIVVQNDTVYQLEQVVGSQQDDRVRSIVKKFGIDLTDCEWIPLKAR